MERRRWNTWRSSLIVAILGVGFGNACADVCPNIPKSEQDIFKATRPEEGGYVINSGDTMQIEVWQNQQLTRRVTVRPDGKITLPLVNDVPASGETVPAFQKRLTARLKQFIKDPIVSVTVQRFSSKRIYINGLVRNAAAFNFTGEMYMLQAMTLAGGLSPFAEGCAVVVRGKDKGFVRYAVPLEPLLSGTDLKENIQLQPNDVITVK